MYSIYVNFYCLICSFFSGCSECLEGKLECTEKICTGIVSDFVIVVVVIFAIVVVAAAVKISEKGTCAQTIRYH